MRALLLLSLLVGCTPVEKRTAVILRFEADALLDKASDWELVVDPQSPYLDADGTELTVEAERRLQDRVLDDAALEMVISVGMLDGKLATVELQPGRNDQPFQVSLQGWQDGIQTVGSPAYGPISFAPDEVQIFIVTPTLLDQPVTPCSDLLDNDGDGWRDAEDPDCADGLEEVGLRDDLRCNDGVDNDEDGLADALDEGCTSAEGVEAPACEDLEDNDEDGWSDAEDPDCAEGAEEVGTRSDLPCNDGADNDTDSFVDAEDDECDSALDTHEEKLGCEDLQDNDSDGWTDDEDPDCLTGDGEFGLGATACNDGIDNEADGTRDAQDPS